MANLGKAQASVTSFTNENTAALVNINLDLTLFRCEPKPEFLPVGSALTSGRREEAESGQIHRTACTLGFLFSEMLPDAAALFKAYGRRVSEILAQPNINPQGDTNDGPFQSFVGADCTSIWAAATSSDASIAVHLLACMLARAFDSKTATSIWVELVQERKQQVDKLLKDNRMIHPYTIVASKQITSRSELAAWDASARAWLRRADESKVWEKHQFAIIVENINLPYTSPGTTYLKVLNTWIKSIEVLNSLLENIPQQASDRAILLAISSWHLYPNLLVFQDKATSVDLKDKSFLPSAVLTLGLEYQERTDIRWSLALSHLRYYGDPVAVRSNEELSRVTMPQLWLVALGSLFRLWDLRASDIIGAVGWLDALGDIISAGGGQCHTEINWIGSFCGAAKTFLSGGEAGRDMNLQLVKFGWRRATNLFGSSRVAQQPFFGLRSPHILGALKEMDSISKGFSYLRELTSNPQLDSSQVLVSFTMSVGGDLYSEWATVVPVPYPESQNEAKHHRWMHFNNTETLSLERLLFLDERQKVIQGMGENFQVISHLENTPHTPRGKGNSDLRLWPNPPPALDTNLGLSREFREIVPDVVLDVTEKNSQVFSIWVDKDASYDLCLQQIKSRSNTIGSTQESLDTLKRLKTPLIVIGYLRSIMLSSPKYTFQSLKRKRSIGDIDKAQYTAGTKGNASAADMIMTRHGRPSWSFVQSIIALQIATLMYDQLPGATVSLRIVDMDICKASWLPDSFDEERDNHQRFPHWITQISATDWLRQMTRAEAFSCIAMFESGRFNIRKEHLADVLALCTENSIFVAGILLRDPSLEAPSGPQIHHLVGSIGQAGLVLLVSPVNPRIRPTGYNPYSVQHKAYDGKRENKFESVSLHLSFTEWKMPLDWASTGEIDQEVFLLESVVSVMHSGHWIGDIDVLELEKTPIDIFETHCKGDCETEETNGYLETMELISLDTWEELLDPPPSVGVFRARSNWVARLAAASILSQRSNAHEALMIGGKDLCWKCLFSHYAYPELHLPQIVID
ncbi:hypothetical protein NUW58_g6931 [Xylaria curta]|uniref:Uncharacterized protein n=1 Tax=Xylaria curta TaxID=42375 RepID=A0ACC1NNI7_9PEZI|nr:hypothetical protein NUW58_g6931 [Xylaria curta]